MPYVDGNARKRLQAGGAPQNAGELNYVISMKVNGYLSEEGIRYTHINDVVGVLEGIKLDLHSGTLTPGVKPHHQGLEELRSVITQAVDAYVRGSRDRLTEAFEFSSVRCLNSTDAWPLPTKTRKSENTETSIMCEKEKASQGEFLRGHDGQHHTRRPGLIENYLTQALTRLERAR